MPRHPPGPRTARCSRFSPGQRGPPSSPALSSSPASWKTTAGPSLALACGSLPLAPGLPRPSRIPTGWAHLFAYFYLCSTLAANQHAGRGGGAGRGSGSGCGGRRFPSELESPRTRCWALLPQPRGAPHRCPRCCLGSARPWRQRQRGCAGASAGARFTCSAGNHGLQDGLRGLRVFQELPLRTQPALYREYPDLFRAWGLCTCSVRCSLACLLGQRLFILLPLPVFPRFARPRPRHQPQTTTRSGRLSQSLPFPYCEASVFLAR